MDIQLPDLNLSCGDEASCEVWIDEPGDEVAIVWVDVDPDYLDTDVEMAELYGNPWDDGDR